MDSLTPEDPGPVPKADPPAVAKTSAQVGALCWRPHGASVEVLLITSRETGRWVIPKGGHIRGLDAMESARREAWEEAGVESDTAAPDAIGCFAYDKLDRKAQTARACQVSVFPFRVRRLASQFPEKGQRRRKWFSPERAATEVAEPELRQLFQKLSEDPAWLSARAS